MLDHDRASLLIGVMTGPVPLEFEKELEPGSHHCASGSHPSQRNVMACRCQSTASIGNNVIRAIANYAGRPVAIKRNGKPMHFSCCVNEAEVTERVEEVKAELRGLIEKGLQERTRIY